MADKIDIRSRVEAVKDYARRNYENGWCDLVIETLSDWEIADIIEGTTTRKGAIWKVSVHFGPFAEQRRSVMNEVF